MKSNKFLFAIVFLAGAILMASANIEKGYYLFPVKPGHQNFLAGNMSEIRPNHFHSGIDIKTEGRQGLPIYAAADGYVYRMKASTFGYGNVIHLRHPNGQITTYAHLRNFNDEIGDYIRKEAYSQKKNEIEVYPDPTALPVKKGDIIAYSGNTGSSAGPHLHFEIRDSLDRALDPLKFGFSEIVDNTPPTVQKVAITPLTIDSRVNGKFQRTEFPVIYDGKKFTVNQDLEIAGKVGIEVLAFDKLDNMHNPNGFPIYQIYDQGEKVFESNVDVIDFNIGRYLLVHTHRNRFTKLYKAKNNLFPFYTPSEPLSGSIDAKPGESRAIEVLLEDVYKNRSTLKLSFKGTEAKSNLGGRNQTAGNEQISYQNNIMVVNGEGAAEGVLAKFFVNGLVMEIPPAYVGSNKRTYLWDMEYGMPDSVDVCTEKLFPDVRAKIPFQQELFFTDGSTGFRFADNTHFDDLYLRYNYHKIGPDRQLTVNSPYEYLWNNLEIDMDASHFEGARDKAHVYLKYENGWRSFIGGQWIGDQIRFKTKNFGTFVIAEDSTPPRINPVRVNSSGLRFTIADNLSGIDSFEAFVDGEWVWMRYEHKQSVIWSEKRDAKPYKGDVLLKVRDKAGNEAVFTSKI
ncbi:M23 family metallopeptidase [Litoribacter ruber]|nr:M23 family metallopeptidase [Litoribacter alkaliphilus]